MHVATATERSTGDPLLLGLDVGTTGTKAVLVDGEGRRVARAARPTPFAERDGRVEMPVDALLATVAAVFADLDHAGERRRVAALGLAAMAESGAPLGADGRPAAPVIAWHDPRGEEGVEVLNRRFGPSLALAVGQRVRAVSSVAKLAWLLDDGVGPVVRWLGVPELCLHALTGAEATEYSLAARTGCYDVTRKRWMPEVPAAVGFDVGVFAGVAAAGEPLGRVSRDGARRFGLPVGVPVTIGGHDHLAGMTGAGVALGDAANSVGTAETVLARSSTPPDVRRALESSLAVTLFPGGREWVVLASAARAGRVLDAVANTLGRTPAELDSLAGEVRHGSSHVPDVGDLLDPLGKGERPQLPRGDDADVWAAFLRALACRTTEAYERVGGLTGRARRMVVFGGGSGSEPWLRAKAATLDLPLARLSTPDAAARGAAIYAGVAAGWWPDADAAPAPCSLPFPGPPKARRE